MARPRIPLEVRKRVLAMRRAHESLSQLHTRVAEAGIKISRGSLHAIVRAEPAPKPDVIAQLKARAVEQPPEPAGAELSPDDDVGHLARRRDELDRALTAWQPQLGHNATAVRAFRGLMAELRETTASLVHLRPRPEAERDHLAELGERARASLLERAATEATPDEVQALRDRVASQSEAITKLLDGVASAAQ